MSAAGDHGRARDLTRTLEWVYWPVGAVIAAIIFAASGFIAWRWLNLAQISPEMAIQAIQLMAAVALLRWPGALYSGVLMGLREHVALNAITVAGSTLAGAGAVLVLWQLSPSVTAFFAWQVVAAGIQTALLMIFTWRKLRVPAHRARFDPAALRAIGRFSAGIFGVTILSIALMQLDKLVLSSTLSLADFGYYTLAFTVANLITTVGLSIHGALFPSISHVVAGGNDGAVAEFYHKCCQVMAVSVVPAGTVLAFFAPELLLLYFHDPAAVARIVDLVTVFATANVLFALMMMPNALQLAIGWTRLSIVKNIIAIALYVPMLALMVRQFGSIGAAFAWLGLTLGYVMFEVAVMHRRVLVGEQARWYWQDLAVPILLSIAIIGAARALAVPGLPLVVRAALAVAGAAGATAAIVWALPGLREFALNFLRNARRRHATPQDML